MAGRDRVQHDHAAAGVGRQRDDVLGAVRALLLKAMTQNILILHAPSESGTAA
jgi:hypothetical protein